MTSNPGSIQILPSSGFVLTADLRSIVDRALTYLSLGYAVHFCGPAGTGKTTLAMHVAHLLGQPTTLLHGSDQHRLGDLVGREAGFERTRVVDNYISKVVRTDERVRPTWMDGRLTTACRSGHTLIYDEFNRSRPETNNALLGILGDGMIDLGGARSREEAFVRVHPDFRMLLTSNPEEYAGTHKTQDALLDRVITIPIADHGRETEIAITASRTGVPVDQVTAIVDIVREVRTSRTKTPRHSLRAAIMLAKVVAARGARPDARDPFFRALCVDILGSTLLRGDTEASTTVESALDRIFRPGRVA